MDAALFQQLNRIYAPLRGRAVRLTRLLAEFQLSREAALAFDWGQLPQDAEVYGVEQYPMDFYTAGMDRAGIAGRIAESTEQAVNAAQIHKCTEVCYILHYALDGISNLQTCEQLSLLLRTFRNQKLPSVTDDAVPSRIKFADHELNLFSVIFAQILLIRV